MTVDPSAEPSCAACSTVFKRKGVTACWSPDPAAAPPRPGNCPTSNHGDVVDSALAAYRPGGADERLARVAAEVEGLCCESRPDGAVHARWTRVEDTVDKAQPARHRHERHRRALRGPRHDLHQARRRALHHAGGQGSPHRPQPGGALYGTNFYYKRLAKQPVTSPRGPPGTG